jgi:hypothetical protein
MRPNRLAIIRGAREVLCDLIIYRGAYGHQLYSHVNWEYFKITTVWYPRQIRGHRHLRKKKRRVQ